MSTVLYSIVSFQAVAPGAQVSLAHGLNAKGTALTPDKLERRGPTPNQFTVTADETLVLVTNNGDAASDIDVLAVHWHSIIRQLGGDPGPDSLSIQPWESNPGGVQEVNALGGGAAPTLGTIGGTGPQVAAQDSWVQVSIGGVQYWLPAWQ